jgi:hypothetical protein
MNIRVKMNFLVPEHGLQILLLSLHLDALLLQAGALQPPLLHQLLRPFLQQLNCRLCFKNMRSCHVTQLNCRLCFKKCAHAA